MNFENLVKAIWRSDAGLTMEEAENLARQIMVEQETRESKVTRVVRAEETR